MDAQSEAMIKSLNLTEKAKGELTKKPKLLARLKYIVEECKIGTVEEKIGQKVLLVAEKLGVTYNHRLPLLMKFILSGELESAYQIDLAISYLKGKGVEEITEDEFKKNTGIGIKLTEDDIRKEVLLLIKENEQQILRERYKYPSNNLLYKIKEKIPFAEPKTTKKIVDEEIIKKLGDKNEDEIKEDKIRAEFDALKKKQKEMKKNFPEEDKKRMEELKNEIKKYDDQFKSIKQNEEEKPEKDKLSSLIGRDMKSALNTPQLLKEHLEATGGKVMTRFPPEPNGYLHIGHAKAMRFSFTSAKAAGGHTYLRLDDTNPEKETKEFIESIEENVKWLGYEPYKTTYSSEYFDKIYEIAIKLIKKGKAYVCNQSKEEMSQYRDQKRDSPYRNRTVEENLKLFEMMRQGRFEEKECCLRMKIDMKHPNPCMRDPVAYRIKYVPHPHCGDKWCIYPTYDFTHCLVDSFENITHSLCTLEFEIRRDSYYWLLEAAELYRPFVWEYSRLNLTKNVLSKRKLTQLVNSHHVNGWDDPRMLTINGLRRKGYTADSINTFIDQIGVTRRGNENVLSIKLLENCIKNELDKTAPRSLAVVDPIKVTLSNVNEDSQLDSFLFPKLKEKGGIKKITLSKVIYIDRIDFKEEEDKDFYGLTPKQEVGLKYGGSIKLENIKKDEKGKITELVCTYSPETKKTKGRIHWISEKDATNAELRIYDYIFIHDDPTFGNEKDPMLDLNPKSLIVKLNSLVNKDLKNVKIFDHFQFERLGFFVVDPDTDIKKERLVFNLTADLGDNKMDLIRNMS